MKDSNLSFSVVISTLDRADSLQVLLRALEAQTYSNFEVIVVVGPVHDNTLEILSHYKDRIRVLRCPDANLARSRNIGLLESRGNIVAFIDDDAVPCRRWLELLANSFENAQIDATGGVVYLSHPFGPTIQFRMGVISSLGEQIDVCSSWLEHITPPGRGRRWIARMMGCNMSFRREALLRVGGFDEFYQYVAEEADLIMRLTKAGMVVYPLKEAPVYHFPASSRYREPFTNRGKWWMQTRSMVYFAIKNGREAGDTLPAIAQRCLHLVHGHLLWYTQLLRRGEWNWWQYIQGCLGEIRAFCSGVANGIIMPRRLIRPALIQQTHASSRQILHFHNEESIYQPGADPVTGRYLAINLSAPPLQVCLLSGNYPPEKSGGIGRYTQMLAKGLCERGHRVHVITRGEREQVIVRDGVYIHRIPYRLDRYDKYRRYRNGYHILNYSHAVYDRVKRLILNEGIEIVCSPLWQAEGLVTAVSGILPVVVWLQTTLQQVTELGGGHTRSTAFECILEKVLLEKSAFIVPISEAIQQAIQEMYGEISSKPMKTIPPGIVPVPDEETRPFNIERKEGPFNLLYVGRLEKRKGILDLFQAIPLIVKCVPNVRILIAGADNSLHDGFQTQVGMNYQAFFIQNYSHYAPLVHFLGEVTDEQLRELYQSCDIFIAPSLYESFGIVYLEAMNYAKPVIGCRTGGVPEVVEDGVTGLLVDPGAPKALAEAVVSLLRMPAQLYEMGMAGRQRVVNNFNYLRVAQDFEEVFREVITKRAGVNNETS